MRFNIGCRRCGEHTSIDIEEISGFDRDHLHEMVEEYREIYGERLDEEKLKNLLEKHQTNIGNRKKIEAYRECPKCGAPINLIFWVPLD